MKLSCATWALWAALATTLTGRPGQPAERPRLTEELRRVAEDRAATNAKQSTASATAADVILLPRMEIGDVYRPRLRQPENVIRERRPFTWKEGGTLLERRGPHVTMELKIQYNPRVGGFDILSFSW